jgi:hypothetical protein
MTTHSSSLLTDLCAALVTAHPTYRIEMKEQELFVGHGVNVRLNDLSGALEIHATALGRGPVVSISAQLPRGYQLRTAVEAVANVATVVFG